MRIVLFGDGLWATESMARLQSEGYELVGIVGRVDPSDTGFVSAAVATGLPFSQPKRMNGEEATNWVAALQPDLCLSIAYDQILRQPLLDIPSKGFVNFHAGKLPNYRGRNIINWAIINGETEIGITAHYIDQGIDTGDIILQQCLPIGWTDTYGDVLDNVVAAFPGIVVEAVSLVASGKANPRQQSHLAGTYFGTRGPGDEWIDWSDTSANIHNKIRGIAHPAPGATTTLDGETIIIWRAFYDTDWPGYLATPGQVVGRRGNDGVVVKTGDSTLLVQEIQTPDGEPQAPVWPIGTRLGVNVQSHIEAMQRQIDDLKAEVHDLSSREQASSKARV